ncbi:hypothetical protein ATSB10_08560 [Dyella thiooxydans]|uniref:Uncharacterized protein n=1 Tax=Dyella thiooxydans TaxID=445710 RepID=A0A160MYH5_9GAMM|nr:hypothetical protein [Dyella thiooxydans]AND68310.1 hypothetical protein ATSB10_08560 [Dyella thiooxydans]
MTTPLPPDPTHDDDLPGEAELRALYGRLPPSEPAPALDAAIRRAAAQAVDADTGLTHPRRRPRWPIALGTAATVVLAAGLAWRMRETPTPQPAAPASVVTAAADAARLDEADRATEAGAKAPRMRAATVGKERVSASPAPAGEAKQSASASPPPSLVSAHPAMQRQIPAAADRVAPTPALRAKADSSAVERPMAVPLAVPMAPAPPPPAPPAPPEPMAPTQFAEPAPALAPTFAPAQNAMTPAAELEAIRGLYAKGATVEADKRLRAFHDSHPDWPLPDDLRRHLDRTP